MAKEQVVTGQRRSATEEGVEIGVRSGISIDTFVEGMDTLKNASFIGNMNERPHPRA